MRERFRQSQLIDRHIELPFLPLSLYSTPPERHSDSENPPVNLFNCSVFSLPTKQDRLKDNELPFWRRHHLFVCCPFKLIYTVYGFVKKIVLFKIKLWFCRLLLFSRCSRENKFHVTRKHSGGVSAVNMSFYMVWYFRTVFHEHKNISLILSLSFILFASFVYTSRSRLPRRTTHTNYSRRSSAKRKLFATFFHPRKKGQLEVTDWFVTPY